MGFYLVLSFCELKCTTFLRVKIHHLKMLILLIFGVGFVENFIVGLL